MSTSNQNTPQDSKVVTLAFRKNRRTICVDCHFHTNLEPRSPRADIWYNQICTAPAVERPQVQDPVTGKLAYSYFNDVGDEVFVDEPHPHCRQINTNGNCLHYVAKGEAIKVR